MRALSAAELLDVWERGQAQSPVRRALLLLSAACPETPPDALAQWRIGRRDAHLLTLREWTFGPRLVNLAICPGCGERLELAFEVADIRIDSEAEPPESLTLCADGYEVRFRLPNSLDLDDVAGCEDVATIRSRLFARCLLGAWHKGKAKTAGQLPSRVVEAVVERMAQSDPQADVQLALDCPACGQHWLAPFDIVSFFWSEIDAWASRTLRDVHELARAYGWREADILAMRPWRRQCYLDMIRG